MTSSPSQRRAVFVAALGFVLLDSRTAEVRLVDSWLSTWTGIGLIAAGMARQDFDLQLTRYDERGWRATFYAAGIDHSVTTATASAWEQAPWRAVQRAAWMALSRR